MKVVHGVVTRDALDATIAIEAALERYDSRKWIDDFPLLKFSAGQEFDEWICWHRGPWVMARFILVLCTLPRVIERRPPSAAMAEDRRKKSVTRLPSINEAARTINQQNQHYRFSVGLVVGIRNQDALLVRHQHLD